MIFDAHPDAPLIFKERLLWLLFLAPFFFLTYGTANQLAALHDHVPSIMFNWEHSIPFIPEMIVPYMSVDLLFGFSFLFVKTRDEVQRHALRLGFVIAFSVLIFLLFPLQFSLDKPAVEGWTKPIFAGLAADLPYNQLPSLHVSLSMIIGTIYFIHLKGIWRWLSALWFVLIVASTLFVYQHHFIDLPTGVLAGLLTFYLIPVKGKTRIPLRFTSPKHLHIALYYLFGSIAFTVLAFKFPLVAIVTGWVALSLLILASSYALGYNPITVKKQGYIKWQYWILFWPYLIGNYYSWKLWKKKVPAMVEVEKGVWIGRSLSAEDADLIKQNKIKTIIDLAPEINEYQPDDIETIYYPLLDLAIPDPKHLKVITGHIDAALEQGNVFIHCKFGLSRSVLASNAWLISQGNTQDEAWQKVSTVQAKRVDRPYMHIALELFKDDLKSVG